MRRRRDFGDLIARSSTGGRAEEAEIGMGAGVVIATRAPMNRTIRKTRKLEEKSRNVLLTELERVRTVEGGVGLGRTGRIGAGSSGPGIKARSMGATVEEGEDNGGPVLGDTGVGGKLARTSREKTLE